MTNYKPTPKVAAGGVAGSLAVLIAFIAAQFGLDLPDYVVAALTTLIAFGAAYLKEDGSSGN